MSRELTTRGRPLPLWLASGIAVLLLSACHGDLPEEPPAVGRAYRMGFSAIPPKPDPAVLVQALELSARRAVGVGRDLQDFPFVQALGLSSYPYFAYPDPEQIPLDYYAPPSLAVWDTLCEAPCKVIGDR